MGSRSGFDADLELDELLLTVDRGSGGVAPAQRQLNAQFNLGLIAMSGGASGGAAQSMVDAEAFTVLTSNYVLTNGTGGQKAFNASANGAITLPVGNYYFEANYMATNTGTTSHTWATLFGGSATFTVAYGAFGISGTAANTPATGGLSGFSTVATATVVTAASVSATEQVNIVLAGVLSVTVAGTVIPQIALSAAPGGTQTMLKGSFIRFWNITAAPTIGNWS